MKAVKVEVTGVKVNRDLVRVKVLKLKVKFKARVKLVKGTKMRVWTGKGYAHDVQG